MNRLLLSFLLVLSMSGALMAQKRLTSGSVSGAYTYIYKLSDREAFYVAAHPQSGIDDSFMHTRIDSFYHINGNSYTKKLPYGNYLYVKPIKNEFHYRLVAENNVNVQFINNRKDFQFIVTDLKGKPISDAKVKAGRNKTVKYDDRAKLYLAKSGSKRQVITVLYNGVYNYFSYDEENRYRPHLYVKALSFFKKLFRSKTSGAKSKKSRKGGYAGYMIFNKPKYKPLDTVKFKAYLVTSKGKAIHGKPLQVLLNKDSRGTGSLLTTLSPYREGGYAYSFVLADSLQLRLDRNYSLVLKEEAGENWEEIYRGSFRYEDYELKSVDFSIRTDKEEHRPGSPVTLFFKATDENELAVPDGRIEVVVRADNASGFYDQNVFIKDSLWKTSLVLDPIGETKLVLPDSIFPKADLGFSVVSTFLNSNNERRTANKSLRYFLENKELKHEFKKDSLYLEYLLNGQSISQPAIILTNYPNSKAQDSTQIVLPAVIKVNYNADDYQIKMSNGFHKYIHLSDLKPGLRIGATQNKDSLRVVVDNSHHIPFWYTIFSGDKVFLKGYAISLDTVIRHRSAKAAHIRLNYLLGEKDLNTETSAFYMPNALNIKLLAPDLVYPGQTVNMQVKVTDVNNQPVAGTDVSAYAYTAKFKGGYNSGVPNFGKRFFARKLGAQFEADALDLSGKMMLRWEKWGKALNLDTLEYYRFTQTKDLYVLEEEGEDPDDAVVSPFVVKSGIVIPAHIVYIDDVPVYFDQADQLQHYAFRVSPGKHKIRMRTGSQIISLDEYKFVKGKKTIISVAADINNVRASVRVAPAQLTDQESSLLTKYMIRIEDNFNGEKAVLATDSARHLLNVPELYGVNGMPESFGGGYLKRPHSGSGLLIGPIAENYLTFTSGTLNQTFLKEPGYTYTFLPGLLKQKSYNTPYGFNTALNSTFINVDHRQYPVKSGEIDSIWNAYLDLRSRTTLLFSNRQGYGPDYGRLTMKLDTSISHRLPYLKNIIIFKYDEPDFLQIYPGSASYFNMLEQGEYRILYLFKDNRYFVAEHVQIKRGGLNYFEWKNVKILSPSSLSKQIDQQIKAINTGQNNIGQAYAQQNILQSINQKYLDPAVLTGNMTGRVFDVKSRQPLPGVHVRIKGASVSTATGTDGSFQLKVPKRGKIVLTYIGYETQEVAIVDGQTDDILLEAAAASLDEVVVVGYGVQKKANLTGSVSTIHYKSEALAGRLAGLSIKGTTAEASNFFIRGNSSINSDQKPLVIVDGLPYSGDPNTLDAATITSIDILKDADATAIYGSRGVAGVIVIKTKGGNAGILLSGEVVQQQQTMRTNFSDYAIWQPKLLTDAEGRAHFTVKFPDDITSWKTTLIAMNGRKQGGVAEHTIKSFKTLSANFLSPAFALAGDSIKVIGKLMNYNNNEETLTRRFSYNGTALLNSSLAFKNAKIDTVSIVAQGAGLEVRPEHINVIDSIQFEYTIKQDNGYFDGELRKIPLFQTGITETKGIFDVLARDTSVTYHFDKTLGQVTLRAEASLFPALLDEMEKLRSYEYLCNEQLASKLKALLMEKTVRKYLGDDFKEEKHIREILSKLQSNRRPEGTWGWWQNSSEELWISLHVVESLLQAQKQGYVIKLDKDRLYSYLLSKMDGDKRFDQIYGIRLLSILNEKYHINDWITAVEKKRAELEEKNRRDRKANSDIPLLAKQPLYEKLQLMQLRQHAGMPIDLPWLMSLRSETMFGNSYWGEQGNRFWDNSIQNTLLAYQILRLEGRHQEELGRIQRYFLEQRRDGQWRNTYESSLILQTILPELMAEDKKPEPAAVVLNNAETITTFPFDKVVEPTALTLQKKGDAPVYVTAYQRFNNPSPEKDGKDFTVSSHFEEKGVTVQQLRAGIPVDLKVLVHVRADADYVMIEIPIPAGCSYENKMQSFWGVETHREYFKHKTSIFCAKLKKGSYSFTVQLMPRYSGNYVLNPAKAEMMYFPVFFGREGMKRIGVK